MSVLLTRINKYKKISKEEFDITNLFVKFFDMYHDEEYKLLNSNHEYIYMNDKYVGYCDNYSSIDEIPKNIQLFRPLKYENHANVLIDMFDELDFIDPFTYRMEICEVIRNNKKKYKGCLKDYNDRLIYGSKPIYAPSIPILKTSLVAQLAFDEQEYELFKNRLINYLHSRKNNHRKDESND